MVVLSKIATNDRHGENSPYFDGWKAYGMNPYHPTKNRDGVIQMGLAENQTGSGKTPRLPFAELKESMSSRILPFFRITMACQRSDNFMGRVRGGRVKFDPDRIVMGGGATGANELIMFCLADPIAQLYLFCMFPGSAKQNMISSFAPVAPPPMTMRSGSNFTRPT